MKHKIRSKNIFKKLKVLIVDDHVMHRKGVVYFLNQYPFITQCDEAQNGLEAIEKMNNTIYDIIFLDIDMPIMNGFEAAKIIKRDFEKTKIQ